MAHSLSLKLALGELDVREIGGNTGEHSLHRVAGLGGNEVTLHVVLRGKGLVLLHAHGGEVVLVRWTPTHQHKHA